MSTPVKIKGGNNQFVNVIDGALVVSQLPVPAFTDEILSLPYSMFFTINGDGVTQNLNVPGTLENPTLAFISSEQDSDVYIKELKIIIADNAGGVGIQLSDFGGIDGGVTNGFLPYFENKGLRIKFNEKPLLNNLDFVMLGSPALGSDETAFRVKGAKTAADFAYLPNWDLTSFSPSNNGVRLIAGTKESLGIEIRDNITSLDAFEILAIGFRRFIK